MYLGRVPVATFLTIFVATIFHPTNSWGEVVSGTVSVGRDGEHELYYEMQGTGEPVVLIHGLTLDHRMWDPQFDVLATDYQVIRYDVLGHGTSSGLRGLPNASVHRWDNLRDLLDGLDVEKAHVVGLSMGAAIAVDFALQFPERVQTLVTLDGGAEGTELDNTPGEFLDRIIDYYTTSFNRGVAPALEQWIQDPLFAPAMQQPELAAKLQEIVLEGHGALGSNAMFQWPNPQKFAELSPPAVTQIGQIDAPTLAVVGELDLPDFHVQIDRLDDLVPNSTKLVIPGVGHMSSMEDPSSVNSALFEFFADHPIITEPNCDFDSNGTCDIGDLDAIFRLGDLSTGVLVTNGEYDRYDLNTDLVIDLSDVGAWLSEAASANQLASPYLYGDANLDGRVDATDLNAIGLNWQTTDASSWASGDFDGDQIVDSTDLNSLALNWQAGVALAGPLGSAVPEPSTMNSLIYFGIVWISLRRRLPSIFRRFATS